MADVYIRSGQAKHVLVVNAGIARFAPWEEHSEKDFDEQFAINVKGPWLAIKHAVPLLAPAASIIATTSVVNRMGMPNSSAYAASKAALTGFCDCLRQEMLAHNVGVSLVFPADTNTPQLEYEEQFNNPYRAAELGLEPLADHVGPGGVRQLASRTR